MSLRDKMILDVALKGEDQGLDGIAIWQEEYYKEPSYKNVIKNYDFLMENKYLRVYQKTLKRIYWGNE